MNIFALQLGFLKPQKTSNMSVYASIEDHHFPVVQVRFTGEKATEKNFQSYLDGMRSIYDRKEKLAVIFNALDASLPGLKYQKMQADWLAENKELMENYCCGTAYVISNALVRGILKAIFAIQKQPIPYIVVGSMEEAEEWVRKSLENCVL